MLTLTFRERSESQQEARREMLELMWHDGPSRHRVMWWQEYQQRGVIHFHVIGDDDALRAALFGDQPMWRQVGRGKDARTVLAGVHNQEICTLWMMASGQTSQEAWAFNMGGILERITHAEDVASYVAAYMQKEAQKTLPDDEAPQGRWWWISPLAKPVPCGTIIVTHWPFKGPHRLVFDRAKLVGKEDDYHGSGNDEHSGAVGGTACGGAGHQHHEQAQGQDAARHRYRLEVVGHKVRPKQGQAGRATTHD